MKNRDQINIAETLVVTQLSRYLYKIVFCDNKFLEQDGLKNYHTHK